MTKRTVAGASDEIGDVTIALVGDIDADVRSNLALVGACEVVTGPADVDPRRHDVAVLDCRREGSWREALNALAPCPAVVLAVVDETQLSTGSLDAATLDDVDETVTPADSATASFRWRLLRRVRRHRRPLELRHRWHPERTALQSIADHTSDWIFVKDLEHRFIVAGGDFAEAVGRPLGEIIGRDDLEIGTNERSVLGDPATGWPGFWPQDDAVVASGEATLEDNPDWQTFSDLPRHKRTVRVPLRGAGGDVYALLSCSSDVTRVMRARDALLRRSEQLDRESRARRVAEREVAEKTRFLAAATHDLRQPLHATGLFIEALARRLETPDQHAVLERIRRSTASLAALFDALMDISRLDAALVEAHVRHVELEPLLEPLRAEFIALGSAKGLHVRVAPSTAVVRSDPVLLTRILRNLLHNAVRYTALGHVALDIRSHAPDRTLEIRVRDSGPGIATSEHDAVFEEFYRAGGAAARGGHDRGLGLGLAIARRTARLIGATLSLASVPGAGATFTVRVPLGRRSSVAPGHGSRTRRIAPGRVVLVLDDEPQIRAAMGAVFGDLGCEVVLATSADGALASLERRTLSPDIVVTDHHLRQGPTGAAAIDAIRRRHGSAIPGVVVTGDTAPQRLLEARRRGFAFLHKPAAPAELARVVAELLD